MWVPNSVAILQSLRLCQLQGTVSSLLSLQPKHIFDMYLCPG